MFSRFFFFLYQTFYSHLKSSRSRGGGDRGIIGRIIMDGGSRRGEVRRQVSGWLFLGCGKCGQLVGGGRKSGFGQNKKKKLERKRLGRRGDLLMNRDQVLVYIA